jgi:hypothetical protein
MINWGSLAANSLWVLGCSVVLAAFSYASWVGAERQLKIRQALRSSGVWLALHIGAIIICAGLAATSRLWYEIVIWVLFGLGFLAHWRWG